MAVNLGDKPLASFSEPIEMLKDCHRRIEHFLDVLRKVERSFVRSELDDHGRRALEAALDYFANFAPRHTADEEQSLFPRMRGSDDAESCAIMADLDVLESDHRRCETFHSLIDRVVRSWLETGRLDDVQRKSLQTALDELTTIYTTHIQHEEQRIFAVASRILEPGQIRELGEEMRRRRSLTSLGDATEPSLEQDVL
ncbi:MAG: hemerythrin domain-containing protein [Pirellulaceae bacterium]|nr:hemerythrin domain-containing protein [Pirellulaceae bacterium]